MVERFELIDNGFERLEERTATLESRMDRVFDVLLGHTKLMEGMFELMDELNEKVDRGFDALGVSQKVQAADD